MGLVFLRLGLATRHAHEAGPNPKVNGVLVHHEALRFAARCAWMQARECLACQQACWLSCGYLGWGSWCELAVLFALQSKDENGQQNDDGDGDAKKQKQQ